MECGASFEGVEELCGAPGFLISATARICPLRVCTVAALPEMNEIGVNGRKFFRTLRRNLMDGDRRLKRRFEIRRELRYKVLRDENEVDTGAGRSLELSSEAVAFITPKETAPGVFVELSISWPVLLQDRCPMQLVVYGRVIRSEPGLTVTSVDKYEFRTQARSSASGHAPHPDSRLERWAGEVRKQRGFPPERGSAAAPKALVRSRPQPVRAGRARLTAGAAGSGDR